MHDSESSPVKDGVALECLERDPLKMDDALKAHELNIVWTLLKRISEHNLGVLSAPLVRGMKDMFPELTTERINALFVWTIWLSKNSVTGVPDDSKNRGGDSVPLAHPSASVDVSVLETAPKPERDPMPVLVDDPLSSVEAPLDDQATKETVDMLLESFSDSDECNRKAVFGNRMSGRCGRVAQYVS